LNQNRKLREMLEIRKANENDIQAVLDLLSQVLEIHAVIRPDLFISGTRKYTGDELREIIRDENRPIFVAADAEGKVLGYCFCILQETDHSNNLRDSRTLFIDDICVDENSRHQHVGRMLSDYVTDYAREKGCYDITLNVWEGNDQAMAFYRKMGFTPRKTVMEKLL